MNKLNIVILALCGHAAGLAVGLIIGSLASGPMREIAAEGDKVELEAEVAQLMINNRKTNAFIGMLIEDPILRDILLEPPISDSFVGQGGWYYPQLAFELFGGRWFAEELMAEGLLGRTFLDTHDILEAGKVFREGIEAQEKAQYDDWGQIERQKSI